MTLPINIEPIDSSDPAWSLWNTVPERNRNLVFPILRAFPTAIGQVANVLNVEVKAAVLGTNISGLIRAHPDDPERCQIKVNRVDNAVRQRFTVAHEISHFLLHREFIDGEGITDTILYRSQLSDWREAQANNLAASMLLPWNTVRHWYSNTFGGEPTEAHIEQIATQFKVSTLAVGYRFKF